MIFIAAPIDDRYTNIFPGEAAFRYAPPTNLARSDINNSSREFVIGAPQVRPKAAERSLPVKAQT
jgi:hypothetical protein